MVFKTNYRLAQVKRIANGFLFQKQNGKLNDYVVNSVMGSKEAYEYTLPANGKVIEEVETGEKEAKPIQPGTRLPLL